MSNGASMFGAFVRSNRAAREASQAAERGGSQSTTQAAVCGRFGSAVPKRKWVQYCTRYRARLDLGRYSTGTVKYDNAC